MMSNRGKFIPLENVFLKLHIVNDELPLYCKGFTQETVPPAN